MTNSFLLDHRDSTNQSTKYSQTDFQAEEKSPEKKTNEQQIQSIITEGTSTDQLMLLRQSS